MTRTKALSTPVLTQGSEAKSDKRSLFARSSSKNPIRPTYIMIYISVKRERHIKGLGCAAEDEKKFRNRKLGRDLPSASSLSHHDRVRTR